MLNWKALPVLVVAAAMCSTTHAHATETLDRADLRWQEMVPGVSFAPAYGDWNKEGHGKFVRILHGTEVPLHIHSNDYHAVVVAGRMANLFEDGQRKEVGPGDYFYMRAGRPHAHDCISEEPCFFYTYGDGSWDIELPSHQP
jgi:quercetin dioxygenase-like cupin family protein